MKKPPTTPPYATAKKPSRQKVNTDPSAQVRPATAFKSSFTAASTKVVGPTFRPEKVDKLTG